MQDSTVFLIGMPGAGKSTLGVLLAKALALPFVDTDLMIQSRAGETLQSFLDKNGYLALRDLEEKVLLEEPFNQMVVATGGSVVYSQKGMERLGTLGRRVYIKIALDEVQRRVSNKGERGIASAPGTTLESIYHERCPLYEKYADVTVACDGLNFEQSLEKIKSLLSS